MRTKLVIATGISGCGRKAYLDAWEKYSKARGKSVRVFHTGEMMLDHAKEMSLELSKDNILNIDPDLLAALRSAVFKGILSELENNQYDAAVICIHGFFYWRKRFIRSYDKFLNQFAPDMYVTFIDDYANVERELDRRAQWRDEKLTPAEILSWQNVEVEVTSGWADFSVKPFFVMPAAQSPGTLYKLLFHPEIEPVYVAMPISHFRDPEDRKGIDAFIERLERYFTVFNPLSIEVVGAIEVRPESMLPNLTLYHHIVYRDLRWFVGQAKKIIAYYPQKVVASPGREHEVHEAFSKARDVWAVYLASEASPFVTHFATKLFRTEADFFAFLEERYPERSGYSW